MQNAKCKMQKPWASFFVCQVYSGRTGAGRRQAATDREVETRRNVRPAMGGFMKRIIGAWILIVCLFSAAVVSPMIVVDVAMAGEGSAPCDEDVDNP